jgi:hypothetical protein
VKELVTRELGMSEAGNPSSKPGQVDYPATNAQSGIVQNSRQREKSLIEA